MKKIISKILSFLIILYLVVPATLLVGLTEPSHSMAQADESTITATPTVTPELTVPEPTPAQSTATPVVVPESTPTPFNSQWTFEKVELNKEYSAPQNSAVKVKFTKLPDPSGNIKIEEIALTSEQVQQTGSLSDKAYSITSDMADGTFQYELTLPKPEGQKDVKIKYAEDIDGLNNAAAVSSKDVYINQNNVNATLDHFTIYIVTLGAAADLTTSKSSYNQGDTVYFLAYGLSFDHSYKFSILDPSSTTTDVSACTAGNVNPYNPSKGGWYQAGSYTLSGSATTGPNWYVEISDCTISRLMSQTPFTVTSFNPTLASAYFIDGSTMELVFDKPMSSSFNSTGFTVSADGITDAITSTTMLDTQYIDITLASPLLFGQTVILSYVPGTVTSADGGVLASFSMPIDTSGLPFNTDATVTSTSYTVSNASNTISNVPFGTSVSTFLSSITLAYGATNYSGVTLADGSTPETGPVQTSDLIKVIAQDGVTVKTYAITTNPPDTTPPFIVSVDSDGQTYNLATPSPHNIKVTFSENVANTPYISVHSVPVGTQIVTDCGDTDTKTFCFDYTIPTAQEMTHTIDVSGAQDAAGNTMVQDTGHTFVVDTIAPSVTVNSFTTNATTPSISGTVDDPNATVVATVNGIPYSASVVGTNWFATVSNALVDGIYDVSATATDLSGNIGTDSTTNELMIDSTAPTIGSVQNDGIWWNTDFNFILGGVDWSISGKHLAQYSLDSGVWQDFTENILPSGYWYYAPINTEGAHSLDYNLTDNAGNSTTGSVICKLDKTAPSGGFNYPSAGDHLRGTTELSAWMSDFGSGLQRIEYWNSSPVGTKIGEIVVPSSATMTWDTTKVSDGAHDLWVVIYDNAGNSYTSPLLPVTVDNTAPSTPIANPLAGDYTNPQSVTLSSTDNISVSPQIYYTTNGTNPDKTSILYSSSINVDADATIKAIAYDEAGNASGVMTAVYGIAPTISSEGSTSITTNSITINWLTNIPATSRVVYDTISHITLGSAPNYGYTNSTVEDTNKVTSHSVVISGLSSGLQYYFRVVSHGSPEAVGSEQSFKTSSPVVPPVISPTPTPVPSTPTTASTTSTASIITAARVALAAASPVVTTPTPTPTETITPETTPTTVSGEVKGEQTGGGQTGEDWLLLLIVPIVGIISIFLVGSKLWRSIILPLVSGLIALALSFILVGTMTTWIFYLILVLEVIVFLVLEYYIRGGEERSGKES